MNDSLTETFRNYLVDSNLGPGDKLETELELAERFKVSRGAMREVIMYLCHMGVLERVKNKGTFIKRITSEKLENDIAFCFQLSGFCFEDLKETRLTLETALAPLVARRISPALIEQMRNNIESMEQQVEHPEVADRIDRDFHILLLSACNNPTLKMFSNVIYLLFRKKFRQQFLNPDAVRKSIRDHRLIMEALVAGDAVKAQKVLTDHISFT